MIFMYFVLQSQPQLESSPQVEAFFANDQKYLI